MSREIHYGDPERPTRMEDPNRWLRGDDPYARAELAREVADLQRLSGRDREVASSQRNFLPPEARTVTTTPAGISAYVGADPRPGRRDPHSERLALAEQARQASAAARLSGSTTTTSTRFVDRDDFIPVASRDAVGRLRIDWTRAHVASDD